MKMSVYTFSSISKSFLITLLLLLMQLEITANEAFNLPPSIDLEKYDSTFAIGKKLLLFEDTHNSFTILDIQKLAPEKWTLSEAETPSFGFTKSSYWVRLDLTNSFTEDKKLFFTIDNPSIDDIMLYFFTDQNNQPASVSYHLGDKLIFSKRKVFHRNFIVPFIIKKNESITIFARIQNKGSMQFPIYLRTEKTNNDHEQIILVAWGAFIGIMLIMSAYNMILFVAIREISYLFFSLSVFSNLIFQLALNGFGFQYLWPDLPSVNTWAIPVFIALFFASSSAFIISFINLKSINMTQYRFVQFFMYLCLALALASPFSNYQYTVIILTLLALPFAIMGISVSATALYHGIKFARFFLWSWIAFTSFILILAMNKTGIFPRNFITENGLQIGNIFSVLFISIALADQINLNKEKIMAVHAETKDLESKAIQDHEKYMQLELEKKQEEIEAQKLIILAREEVLLARAQSATKSNFLATMSHELRTPLNGILGISELFKETSLSKKQSHYLETIHNSGESLLVIINDVLDFSQIEAGKMNIEKRIFNLHNLLTQTVSNYSDLAKEKNIQLIKENTTELPEYIYSDSNRIQQILNNLISNAIKFTPDGSIIIKTAIETSVDKSNPSFLKFSILDTGIGITEAQQKSLFKDFSQADNSTTRKYGGSGLGLSICKSLAKLMDGEIGVVSLESKGSDFWFTILYEEISPQQLEQHHVAHSTTASKPKVSSQEQLNSMKVLVAEDNVTNQLVIISMLKKLGVEATLVNNGEEAYQYAIAHHADLDFILMDCEMPVLDGYDATRKLRLWEQSNDKDSLSVFALTAHAMEEHKKASVEAGMNAHISKPVNIKILYKTIVENLLQ